MIVEINLQALQADIAKLKRELALLKTIERYGNAVSWASPVCTNDKLDEKKLDDLIRRRGGMADTLA